MSDIITGTEKELQDIVDLDAVEAGLPRRGIHVGEGIHVEMSDDPTSPGWTTHRVEAYKYDKKYALEVDEAIINLGQKDAKVANKLAAKVIKDPAKVESLSISNVKEKS